MKHPPQITYIEDDAHLSPAARAWKSRALAAEAEVARLHSAVPALQPSTEEIDTCPAESTPAASYDDFVDHKIAQIKNEMADTETFTAKVGTWLWACAKAETEPTTKLQVRGPHDKGQWCDLEDDMEPSRHWGKEENVEWRVKPPVAPTVEEWIAWAEAWQHCVNSTALYDLLARAKAAAEATKKGEK